MTAHLFSGGTQEDRISTLNQRLAKAIVANSALRESVTSQRRELNTMWKDGALTSAASRPADLFTLPWWNKNKPSGASNSYFTSKASEEWWGSSNWQFLTSLLEISDSTRPFVYVYDQNLTFKNDVIYVNAQPVGSYDDFVASARQLAKSGVDANTQDSNWSPLGTFALSTSAKTKTSDHAIQLVVDRAGNIAGTYANWGNGTVQPIHGKIDRETQRAAFDIGGRANLTIETGITNLTNAGLRVWAHLPDNHSQTWFLARIRQ
jgi:hypothetical protein